MTEVSAAKIADQALDQAVQNYFRERQKNLKPFDIEGLIRNFDSSEERVKYLLPAAHNRSIKT